MAIEDDIRNLARNPTLATLDPEALRQLAVAAETRILRNGEVLFRRDEPSDGGYVLVSGSIALDPSDHGQGVHGQRVHGQAAHIVRPPTLIGDMALIAKTKRPATAIAREPTTTLKISRTLFHRILDELPRSAERLKRVLSDRLLQFLRELEGIAASESEDR